MSNTPYKVFTLRNFRDIPQVKGLLSVEMCADIDVVGNVLPFKVNNYVIDELIDWNNIPNDPIFQLTFPQKEMLSPSHFRTMKAALAMNLSKDDLKAVADKIRYELNPQPDGQQSNVPTFHDTKLTGIQHKYDETLLFFPSNSQTCHAYCSFCFRWPQFVGMDELKFAMQETELLVNYVREHPQVTDVLFTGGDPMVMSAAKFASYVDPLIDADIPNLKTIRIGTKSLSFWPYKFLTDKDADDMLRLFERIVSKGYHLAFMAHFNHPAELKTEAVRKAIKRILNTGAVIRTQSPIMKHINCNAGVWKELWEEQVKLGCVPYYMFLARDTGAQDYFAVTLGEAFEIYRTAFRQISGITRTAKGPSMSANPGKIEILGVETIMGRKVFTMRFIQARDPRWVGRPFYADYNPDAIWLDDLVPAFNEERFFFEEEVLHAAVG
jgi:KamA family protein